MTLLGWNGKVLSAIDRKGPSNGKLGVSEFHAYPNPERRFGTAREFIREKVAKSLELVERMSCSLPVSTAVVRPEADRPAGPAVNEVGVYDLRVAPADWTHYARAVKRLWPKAGFGDRRSPQRSWNNSAADPANGLLKYDYALLEAACRLAITSVGLVP